ncbi:MAG: hypothetical protein LAT58_09450 [Opitutales bacterium]|nr:hypothetical protein [Opitutales bacterium]
MNNQQNIFRIFRAIVVLLCLPFFLTACADNRNSENGSPTGPEGYIRGTLEKGSEARVTTALIQVRQAIDHYEIHEGTRPASLERLVEAGLLPSLPTLPHNHEFEYNPTTGKVEVKGP